jgi:coenzyme F420-dependent glucose-6-phosphate dehydrogenase
MTKIYWFCSDEQFQPEVLVEHAVLAEKAGFEGVMVSEHFHPWVDDVGTAGFAFTTLGAIAAKTNSVKLLTAVTTPLFRFHPAVVAQAAATIDRLTNGRFELGVGTGENINEGPLGFELPPYKERSARMHEANQIMRRLLDGETLTYDGEFYKTDTAKLYSPPIGKVPIYMAAGGPQSARSAGRDVEGVITSVKQPSETIENVINPAKETAGEKPFTVVANRWSVYGQNDDDAWEALKAQRGLRAPSRATAADPRVLQHEADELPREDILSRYSRVASADDYIHVYSPLITDLNADIIGIQTTSTDIPATIEMLGRDVLPKLRALKEES